MKNGDIFHFFCFDFDRIFVVNKIFGMYFNILTYWFDSTVHVKLLILKIEMYFFI